MAGKKFRYVDIGQNPQAYAQSLSNRGMGNSMELLVRLFILFIVGVSYNMFAREKEPGRYTWRQAEKDLTRDIFEHPGETVAGLAWNFEQTHVDKVAKLLASGDFAAAKENYDKLREDIRLNWDGLSTMAQMQGENYGPMTSEVGARSHAILSGEYNQREVQLSDGTKTTIGKALANLSSFLAGKTAELRRIGFDYDVTNLYLQNDRVIKVVMDPLLKKINIGEHVQVQNRLAVIELAESYAANRQRVIEIFGGDAVRFMALFSEIHTGRRERGKMTDLRVCLDHAEKLKRKSGMSGMQLIRTVLEAKERN